jgi:outer membrane receptor for ferrienterochelin and colicin
MKTVKVLTRSALAVALMGAVMSFGANAQSTSGAISGSADAGSTIVIESTTGLSRTVVVDANGRYNVGSLPVGSYTVKQVKDGATVGTRNITVAVSSTTDASFDATTLAAIEVVGSRMQPIDVTQVDSRMVITAEQLAKLPIARSADAIAQLAPGVIQGSSDFVNASNGQRLSSFGGASISENAYYINGMNVTDPLKGFGGIELPYGSIEQQEVLTGGYGAAYGRTTGGVISQIGKRGTNEWKFGGQLQWTPEWGKGAPRNTYYSDALPGDVGSKDLYQYREDNVGWSTVQSAYVGGPIIQDKLYVFASVEGARSEDSLVGTKSSSSQISERTFKDPKWYAKVDWNITNDHVMELTAASTEHKFSANNYQYDYGTFRRGDYLGKATATDTKALMWIGKYTGYLTDNLTVSAQYGEQTTDLKSNPDNKYSNLIPVGGSANQNPALNGGVPITNANKLAQLSDPKHQTFGANYRLDVTYHLGDHAITAGIDNQRTEDRNDSTIMAPDAGFYWLYGRKANPMTDISEGEVDAPGKYPGGEGGYFVSKYIQETLASVKVTQRAQYIEDNWQVNDRWLVKLGLRNDQFINYNPEGQAYIKQTKPQWAPRLGFAWDVNGDGTFKVYGNAGRYYLALPTSLAARGAAGSIYTNEYYTYTGIDANGNPTGLTPIDTINGPGVPYSANREYGQSPDPKTVTAKNLKAQSQDEFIVGFDKVFNESWNYGAKLTYRKLNNAIDDTCYIEKFEEVAAAQGIDTTGLRGCYFFNPGDTAVFNLPDGKGGYSELTLTNADLGYPAVKRTYMALDAYIEHPFDGKLWGRVTYTFAHSRGNTEGQVKSDIGQGDISATQDWDYPYLMEYGSGRLPNDRTHQLKAMGMWQINPEWSVSSTLQIMSGTPNSCQGAYGPDETYPAYAGNYYHWCGGKPAKMGDAGETPWIKNLNLNAEYRPSFADGKLAFSVDVLNVFNEQKATRLDPDYSPGTYRQVLSWQAPRSVRLGVTYDF